MKNLVILLLLLASSQQVIAQKYFTKTGLTLFKASVEAFEPVEAENNSSTAILDTSNGQIAALLFIKAFHFEIALMEEHFNENYMDSDKFPKAQFKGLIKEFNFSELTKEEQEYMFSGELIVRGVSKTIEAPINLKIEDNKIFANSTFIVTPEDFEIEIPNIVKEKIAKSIIITFNYELIEKK